MRLTQFTDFAIRVMLYLAAHEDRLCSIGEIAGAYGISQNHLMKVVSDLAGSGYVQSLRGRGGGIRLARPAAEINIGQMVRHTEGKVDLVGCGGCPLAPACGMVCASRTLLRASSHRWKNTAWPTSWPKAGQTSCGKSWPSACTCRSLNLSAPRGPLQIRGQNSPPNNKTGYPLFRFELPGSPVPVGGIKVSDRRALCIRSQITIS